MKFTSVCLSVTVNILFYQLMASRKYSAPFSHITKGRRNVKVQSLKLFYPVTEDVLSTWINKSGTSVKIEDIASLNKYLYRIFHGKNNQGKLDNGAGDGAHYFLWYETKEQVFFLWSSASISVLLWR